MEATQWFRNGDHPADESTPIGRPGGSSTTLTEGKIVRHMHAGIPGDRVCMECGNVMRRHGLIDGPNGEEETVHPGDYIVTHVKGHFYRRGQKEFEAMFEPFEHVVATTELKPAIDISELEARIKALEEMQASSDHMIQ